MDKTNFFSSILAFYPWAILAKVVILGIQRRLDVLNGQDGQTNMSFCPLSNAHIGHMLWIFFENTSNFFKYAWICINSSLLNEHEAYGRDNFNGRSERTSEWMNNYDFRHVATYRSSSIKEQGKWIYIGFEQKFIVDQCMFWFSA